jgi:hypothetical protein
MHGGKSSAESHSQGQPIVDADRLALSCAALALRRRKSRRRFG